MNLPFFSKTRQEKVLDEPAGAPMTSFFLQVGSMGTVDQVIWSDPVDVVSKDCGNIFALFAREDKTSLLRAMKKCAGRAEAFFLDAPLRLRDRASGMSVCMLPVKKNYLIFASDEQEDAERGRGFRSIVLMFLNILKGYVERSAAYGRSPSGAEQTEMIQTLVGELKSRKQQLEETNDRLSRANEDLNNRLVKDSLTGLVSRYQYRAEIEYLIGRNPGKLGVFVFLDIDDFKAVNDRCGHAAGDQYLIEFAERMKRIDVANAVRMRISGDEFGLFVFGLGSCGEAEMKELWRKIKTALLSGPIDAGGHRLPVSVSAGMAVYGRDTEEVFDLIERADRAMYTAKRRGKNRYCVYSELD